jgi:hypothetical protein
MGRKCSVRGMPHLTRATRGIDLRFEREWGPVNIPTGTSVYTAFHVACLPPGGHLAESNYFSTVCA